MDDPVVDVGEEEVAPAVANSQTSVVEATQVKNGGVQIVHMHLQHSGFDQASGCTSSLFGQSEVALVLADKDVGFCRHSEARDAGAEPTRTDQVFIEKVEPIIAVAAEQHVNTRIIAGNKHI